MPRSCSDDSWRLWDFHSDGIGDDAVDGIGVNRAVAHWHAAVPIFLRADGAEEEYAAAFWSVDAAAPNRTMMGGSER